MGFNIYVNEDKRRDIESWCFTETHQSYQKWYQRLKIAHEEVSDMFIMPKPFFLYTATDKTRPHIGEISLDIFFREPHQIDFDTDCFMVNTEFWKHCGATQNVFEMIETLGEILSEKEGHLKVLREWQHLYGLHCFAIY